MGIIFFIPLALIAFFESTFDKQGHAWIETWFRGEYEGSEDRPENRNPQVNDPNREGLEISKVPFEELIKVFPNTGQVGFPFVLSSQMVINKFICSRVKRLLWKRCRMSKNNYMLW